MRFAQYHMRAFVPAHDNRMNIGAKGLSGEGYKGHCFWDTEIFLLPYYMFTAPETARKLEEYRILEGREACRHRDARGDKRRKAHGRQRDRAHGGRQNGQTLTLHRPGDSASAGL